MGRLGRFVAAGFKLIVGVLLTAPVLAESKTATSSRAPVSDRPSPLVDVLKTNPNTDSSLWSRDADYVASALDVPAIILQDAANQFDADLPLRVGVNRSIDGGSISSSTHGTWSVLDDAGSLWTARFQFPGAKGVRLHVAQFEIPDDGRLIITSSPNSSGDVYSRKSQRGETEFWTAATIGDVIFMEYSGPRNANGSSPEIVIDEVSELYRPADGPSGVASDSAVADTQQTETLDCEEDVNCHDVSVESRDAVGRMQYTISGQGTYVCSGALLNDADPNTFAGYFLTAAHCIDTPDKASSLTVTWFYQSDLCNGSVSNPLSHPRSNGAKLLAIHTDSDAALLQLNDDPSDGQGFAAWTTEPPSGIVREIHHPGGSYKRFSEGEITNAPPNCTEAPVADFFYNKWSVGITEGGSSGAPLFNDEWKIVGQQRTPCYFTDDPPTCTNPDRYNNAAGRFSSAYRDFASFLDQVVADDAFEDADSFSTAAPLALGSYALRLVDFDDYFSTEFEAAARLTAKASFNTADMDLDLYLLDASGQVVAKSEGTTGVESFTASIAAGRYVLRAHKAHGWGGDYQLDWTAIISTCPRPDDVVVTDPAEKNRFLSIVPGNAGTRTALRVTLYSLHHPDPPYGVTQPRNFSDEEFAIRWVGPWNPHTDENGNTIRAAELQCEPHFADWGSVGEVQVFGPEVVPSSLYVIDSVLEFCDQENQANFSPPLGLRTTRWGDVAAPFQPAAPATLTQPNVQDVAAIIATFRNAAGAIPKPRALLQPAELNPSSPISVLDIAAVVDAFRGFPYDLDGPTPCP